jgi:hypothetical protein
METLRCPTCVTLLPDPDAARCPACHAKLRKRRGRPIVLGESNRLSGRSLPVDVELRLRAEHRYEPFESKAKVQTEPLDRSLRFSPAETRAPGPAPEPETRGLRSRTASRDHRPYVRVRARARAPSDVRVAGGAGAEHARVTARRGLERDVEELNRKARQDFGTRRGR